MTNPAKLRPSSELFMRFGPTLLVVLMVALSLTVPAWRWGLALSLPLLALAIYINFFSHHYVIDIRWALFAASALIYGPCVIWFRPDRAHRFMPLLLGLVLVLL